MISNVENYDKLLSLKGRKIILLTSGTSMR